MYIYLFIYHLYNKLLTIVISVCFVVKILVIPEGLRAPCLAIGLPGTSNKADNYSTMKKANN